MKKEYEKPVVEIIVFTEEVHTTESEGERSYYIGGWWP